MEPVESYNAHVSMPTDVSIYSIQTISFTWHSKTQTVEIILPKSSSSTGWSEYSISQSPCFTVDCDPNVLLVHSTNASGLIQVDIDWAMQSLGLTQSHLLPEYHSEIVSQHYTAHCSSVRNIPWRSKFCDLVLQFGQNVCILKEWYSYNDQTIQ